MCELVNHPLTICDYLPVTFEETRSHDGFGGTDCAPDIREKNVVLVFTGFEVISTAGTLVVVGV